MSLGSSKSNCWVSSSVEAESWNMSKFDMRLSEVVEWMGLFSSSELDSSESKPMLLLVFVNIWNLVAHSVDFVSQCRGLRKTLLQSLQDLIARALTVKRYGRLAR